MREREREGGREEEGGREREGGREGGVRVKIISSMQFGNTCNLKIVLHIFESQKCMTNLEIVYAIS